MIFVENLLGVWRIHSRGGIWEGRDMGDFCSLGGFTTMGKGFLLEGGRGFFY